MMKKYVFLQNLLSLSAYWDHSLLSYEWLQLQASTDKSSSSPAVNVVRFASRCCELCKIRDSTRTLRVRSNYCIMGRDHTILKSYYTCLRFANMPNKKVVHVHLFTVCCVHSAHRHSRGSYYGLYIRTCELPTTSIPSTTFTPYSARNDDSTLLNFAITLALPFFYELLCFVSLWVNEWWAPSTRRHAARNRSFHSRMDKC